MKDFDKLVDEIMRDMEKDGEPITRAEAEEMARMEIGAKENAKHYERADAPKKAPSKPKVVKVSAEKTKIFEDIVDFLAKDYDIVVEIPNKKVKIHENGKNFTLDLVENRQKS